MIRTKAVPLELLQMTAQEMEKYRVEFDIAALALGWEEWRCNLRHIDKVWDNPDGGHRCAEEELTECMVMEIIRLGRNRKSIPL